MNEKKKETGKATGAASFEEALAELQKLVEQLEGGKLPLAESLAVYEKAIALSLQCTAMLEDAEQKIMRLTDDGEVPFDLADGEGD